MGGWNGIGMMPSSGLLMAIHSIAVKLHVSHVGAGKVKSSQATEWAEPGEGRGLGWSMMEKGKGLLLLFSHLFFWVAKIRQALCTQNQSGHVGRSSSPLRKRWAEMPSCCSGEGVRELQWEEAGKGECEANTEGVMWAYESRSCRGLFLTTRQ